MKTATLLFATILLSIAAIAQPPAGDAKPGNWYGQKVSKKNALPIQKAASKLNDNNAAFDTKFTATVLDVCAKKGCWMKVAINDSTTAMVKMKDYAFFVPVAAIGKKVVIDGEMKLSTTSVEELQHYAEDAKKSKEQIAAITKPEKEISVMAKGITVLK